MKLFTKYNIPDNAGFVNVELAKDNTVWIDPMMMHMDKSEMGKRCCLIVQQYFSHLLKLAINNDYKIDFNRLVGLKKAISLYMRIYYIPEGETPYTT